MRSNGRIGTSLISIDGDDQRVSVDAAHHGEGERALQVKIVDVPAPARG